MAINVGILRQLSKEIIDLSAKSAILADPKSKIFCTEYSKFREHNDHKLNAEFFASLTEQHGLSTERLYDSFKSMLNISKSSSEFRKNFKQFNYDRLNNTLRPQYYSLFQNLGRVKDGVHTLVKIRHDLLTVLEDKKKHNLSVENEEDLKILNSVLKSLLSLWFSTGLLNIQRIDWKSSATLVEKVAQYESVHRIRTLSDLKNRLGTTRRCFIYTHSTMPYEPLVILHIALTNSITSNIGDLIRPIHTEQTKHFDATKCTNAIFYSINSCQKGLQQVDLGNALIKSCVRLLIDELPNLKHFHTLSPIPKFKEWLDLKLTFTKTNKNDQTIVQKFIKSDELNTLKVDFNLEEFNLIIERLKFYVNSPKFKKAIEENKFDDRINKIAADFLTRACAYYLYYEKKNGYALNSVCNFHIKNGAQIYRINFGGDLSDKGWNASYSLMVNYGYYLDDVNTNCVNYLSNKTIRVSDQVQTILNSVQL